MATIIPSLDGGVAAMVSDCFYLNPSSPIYQLCDLEQVIKLLYSCFPHQ